MNNIDLLAQTKTTAQILRHYSTVNSIDQLEVDLETCSKGMYLAIQHIRCKGIITPRVPILERVELIDLDIIQEMRGED